MKVKNKILNGEFLKPEELELLFKELLFTTNFAELEIGLILGWFEQFGLMTEVGAAFLSVLNSTPEVKALIKKLPGAVIFSSNKETLKILSKVTNLETAAIIENQLVLKLLKLDAQALQLGCSFELLPLYLAARYRSGYLVIKRTRDLSASAKIALTSGAKDLSILAFEDLTIKSNRKKLNYRRIRNFRVNQGLVIQQLVSGLELRDVEAKKIDPNKLTDAYLLGLLVERNRDR